MIDKILTEEEAVVRTYIEVTPQELICAARKLDLARSKGMPGQEIELPFSKSVTLRFNPNITLANIRQLSKNTNPISPPTDEDIRTLVAVDEARSTGSSAGTAH